MGRTSRSSTSFKEKLTQLKSTSLFKGFVSANYATLFRGAPPAFKSLWLKSRPTCNSSIKLVGWCWRTTPRCATFSKSWESSSKSWNRGMRTCNTSKRLGCFRIRWMSSTTQRRWCTACAMSTKPPALKCTLSGARTTKATKTMEAQWTNSDTQHKTPFIIVLVDSQ